MTVTLRTAPGRATLFAQGGRFRPGPHAGSRARACQPAMKPEPLLAKPRPFGGRTMAGPEAESMRSLLIDMQFGTGNAGAAQRLVEHEAVLDRDRAVGGCGHQEGWRRLLGDLLLRRPTVDQFG